MALKTIASADNLNQGAINGLVKEVFTMCALSHPPTIETVGPSIRKESQSDLRLDQSEAAICILKRLQEAFSAIRLLRFFSIG